MALAQGTGERCLQRGAERIEGHLMQDHVHMCLSVPPKFSFAFVVGFLIGMVSGEILVNCYAGRLLSGEGAEDDKFKKLFMGY